VTSKSSTNMADSKASLFRSDLKDKQAPTIDISPRKLMVALNEGCQDPYQLIQKDFLKRLEQLSLNRYMSPTTDLLHQRLADYAGVKKEQILFGNGADDMLYHLFLAVRENAQSFALSLAPSYFDYATMCGAVDLGIRFLDMRADFSFDVERYIELAQDPDCRLAILCNPNNPTANLLPAEQIRQIITALPDKLVVVDEAYYEFSGVSFVSELDEYPNLILIRSFSKGFSAAGLRFGYAISSPQNIAELWKTQITFHTSSLVKAFALCILENKELFLGHVQQIKALRDRLYRDLKELPQLIVHPSATNFLTFSLAGKSDDLYNHLQEHDITVRNVGSHPALKSCLRVSISCEDAVNAFRDQVRAYLAK